MGTRKNVRERRMEKIRQLQEGAVRRNIWPPDVSYMSFTGDKKGVKTNPNLPMDGETPYSPLDPEVEWRSKWKREWSAYHRSPEDEEGDEPRANRVAVRILLSGLLFVLVWGLFQFDNPWANRGKIWVSAALNESLDTAAVAAWYRTTFGGAPSFLPALNPEKHQEAEKVSTSSKHYFSPVQGKLIAAFTPNDGGVLVEAKAGAPVAALDTGVVSFAGVREDTSFTVVVRHADGLESVYGNLEQGKVRASDWIKGGETLGTVAKRQGQATGTLYFAILKTGTIVNPTDVVSFD